MKKEEPLFVKTGKNSIKNLILWWEKKRIYYNITLVLVMCFALYELWHKVELLGAYYVAKEAIYWLFGANLFFTLGWIVGIPFHFLYKIDDFDVRARWVLLVFGTLFSMIWTLIGFEDAIAFAHMR